MQLKKEINTQEYDNGRRFWKEINIQAVEITCCVGSLFDAEDCGKWEQPALSSSASPMNGNRR